MQVCKLIWLKCRSANSNQRSNHYHVTSLTREVVLLVAVVVAALLCQFVPPAECASSSSASSSDESAERNGDGGGGSATWLDFTHEKCQKDVLTSNQYKTFYKANNFYRPDGIFELLVRFKGIADGHVILTSNATSDEPRYTISLGSYNNRFSEIRRNKPNRVEVKISTPSIMSDLQFRGFIIQYNSHEGHVSVFGEGSDVALLHMEDTMEPLNIKYFSFATWHNRMVQVAFNCLPKDSHSTVDIYSHGKKNHSILCFIASYV